MKLLNDPVLPIAVPLAALVTAAGIMTLQVRQSPSHAAKALPAGVVAAPAELLQILNGKRQFTQEEIPLVVRVMHRAGYDNFLCTIDPSTGDMTVTTGKNLTPHLDIKPGSCPNPIQVGPGGTVTTSLPTGILGNAFDVTQIDLGTVRLSSGEPDFSFLTGAQVTPIHLSFSDVGTPFEPSQNCECSALGPDGILDLLVQYNKSEVVNTLSLAGQPEGASVRLRTTGIATGGATLFSAIDCVRIQHH